MPMQHERPFALWVAGAGTPSSFSRWTTAPMNSLPPEIAAFDEAQRNTIALMRSVVSQLRTGMSERDVYDLALAEAPAFGMLSRS